jgi:acetyl esterase/lipase
MVNRTQSFTRIIGLILTLLILTLGLTHLSGKPTPIFEISSGTRYLDPIYPDTMLIKKYDLPYSPGLTLDIYYSVDTSLPKPTLILFHGGGFYNGDTGVFRDGAEPAFGWGSYFAKRGYVVIAANYHKADHFVLPTDPDLKNIVAAAASDAQTAIRWAKQNAATYGIDPDRLVLGGTSAGAVIALSAAYAGGSADRVQAVISLAGTVLPSALNAITPGMPPALMLHGDADPLVPYSWALDLKNTLVARGIRVDWHVYPGKDHIVANYHHEAEALIPPFLVSVLHLGDTSTPLPSPSPSPHNVTRSPLPAQSDTPTVSPSVQYRPADLNRDGQVDHADFELFRTQFQNGTVDIYDYNTLVGAYDH